VFSKQVYIDALFRIHTLIVTLPLALPPLPNLSPCPALPLSPPHLASHSLPRTLSLLSHPLTLSIPRPHPLARTTHSLTRRPLARLLTHRKMEAAQWARWKLGLCWRLHNKGDIGVLIGTLVILPPCCQAAFPRGEPSPRTPTSNPFHLTLDLQKKLSR
jgi:hypothetical protein